MLGGRVRGAAFGIVHARPLKRRDAGELPETIGACGRQAAPGAEMYRGD
jgi:hypothetical protein